MTTQEIQFEIIRGELELTQRQMDKYDQLLTTTKTWAITLWIASLGWSVQTKQKDIVLVSIVAVTMFWFFDALNKAFRQNYKKRRDAVARALEHIFQHQTSPDNFTAPKLPVHEWAEVRKNFAGAHVALPYVTLIIISLILYVRL